MITGIAHINLTVPEGSLHLADEFYRDTLGLKKVPVPKAQQNTLAWLVHSPQIGFLFPYAQSGGLCNALFQVRHRDGRSTSARVSSQ